MTFWNNLSGKCYDMAGKPSTMLLITGILGWALSSVAQVTAIEINKKIPKEQKKFLVPQELCDAAVNITAFALCTRYAGKIGDKLVSSGKFITPKIEKFLENTVGKDGKKLVDSLGKEVVNKDGKKELFSIGDIPQISNPKTDVEKDISNHYYSIADGVSFTTSVLGSVLAGNVITPVCRNKLAAHYQHNAINKNNPTKNEADDKSKYMMYSKMPFPNANMKV